MKRRYTLGTLLFGMLAGCISMPAPYDSATGNKAETIAEIVRSQKAHDGVRFQKVKLPSGETRYEALMLIENQLYLVGAVDRDDDGDPDILFIYAKEVDRKNLKKVPEDKRDLETIAAKTPGKRLYELTDLGINGTCEHAKKVDFTLLKFGYKNTLQTEIQRLYGEAVSKVRRYLRR